MIVEASITGLFKTILIIIGAIFLLRLLGQLFVAKKNMAQERLHLERERRFAKEKETKLKNLGKTKVIKERSDQVVEDVDYEDIDS